MTNIITPRDIQYWVFDMDGTLTQAVHDFSAIRKALDIAEDEDILVHLANLPETERVRKKLWLMEHEKVLAENARPALGAVELVKFLKAKGCQLAILTRNDRRLAYTTLDAIGLSDYFLSALVLGRDEAEPKPSKAGMLRLADYWQVAPEQMLIAGDHLHDLASGKNAGSHTILVNEHGNQWPEYTDWYYASCKSILAALQQVQ